MRTLRDFILDARAASVPFLTVATLDQPRTMREVAGHLGDSDPVISWAGAVGLAPVNGRKAEQALARALPQGMDPANVRSLSDALEYAGRFPEGAALLIQNGHFGLDAKERGITDALVSLRDGFKANGRTLIFFGPSFAPPVEVREDVVEFAVPLPTADEHRAILKATYKAAESGYAAQGSKLPTLTKADEDAAVEALKSAPPFPSEQLVSLAIGPKGLDVAGLWSGTVANANKLRGVTLIVDRDRSHGFESVVGYGFLKKTLRSLASGGARFGAILLLDEMDKSITGAALAGDNTGTAADTLGFINTWMEPGTPGAKLKRAGMLFGVPGAGKTTIATAAAVEFGVPFIRLDLSALKESLLGASGENLRRALALVDNVSGGVPLIFGTANRMDGFPAELRARFRTAGEWFFDLPTNEERNGIWDTWLDRAAKDLPAKDRAAFVKQSRPNDTGWVGRDIRTCVLNARDMGWTLAEAAATVVPFSVSSEERLRSMRGEASGRFLDPTRGGIYTGPVAEAYAPATQGRAIKAR